MKKSKKYNYFYKITNIVNNHYYYGIHSTDNLDDGYMGSGVRLKSAIKKYGIENFKKEILNFFETRGEASKYESEMVTESLIRDDSCYNIILGGEEYTTLGTSTVKDENGKVYQIPKDDERILNGSLVGVTKGYVTAKDLNGNTTFISVSDERYLNGEFVPLHKNNVRVIDNKEKCFMASSNDERLLNGELTTWSHNRILSKNKNGKCYFVDKEDERLKNGELIPFWKGKKISEKRKEQLKKTLKEIGHQQGEKNSQYGTCWITKDGVNKKIKKEDLSFFEIDGWIKGRKMK